ncbi:LuxR C-terminal-related transcriptional regulator [Rouxiella sp. Mn2063]|uniref:LuxR C-terminal-related transcriptional regulator n=1 Tax=Rouxiella sp. Mn2063 TaxID=3395262 RepID=UPI003BDEFBEC
MSKSQSNIGYMDDSFPYEMVLILDRLTLTGRVIVDEVNKLAGRHCALHALNIATLREVIISPVMRRKNILVIAELSTDFDSIHDGFNFLDELTCLSAIIGRHRCMVYTALREPLLLQAIVDKQPDAIVRRDESMSVFRKSLQSVCAKSRHTLMSPAVSSALQENDVRKLSPRELLWVLMQLNDSSLSGVARRLHRSEKTVSTHRRAVAERLGLQNSLEINRWLGQIQDSMGSHRRI